MNLREHVEEGKGRKAREKRLYRCGGAAVRRALAERDAAPRCWGCCVVLEPLDRPGERVVAVPPCRRRSCGRCLPGWRVRWLELAAGLFGDRVHMADVPAADWRATKDAARAATLTEDGSRYLTCRRDLRHGERVLVFAAAAFEGSTRVSAGRALEALAAALRVVSRRRRPVTTGRGWKLARPESQYARLYHGPARSARPALSGLLSHGAELTGRWDHPFPAAVFRLNTDRVEHINRWALEPLLRSMSSKRLSDGDPPRAGP
jgi:hypothetical protein